ncbi:MAG: integration host factor subunit beta [Deltaproteobacteria bacterium]|nr:MAG: integration host factor subunit beta [Deltaproteobacteria bacterium]
MVKAELIQQVAEKCGLKTTEAQKAVDAVFESIAGGLARGERIELRGFATFAVKNYKAYTGRNPKTGEPIAIKPKRGVVFRPGSELRRRVNGNSGSTKNA